MNRILFTEEEWADSQLSIARYYGRVRINGEFFIIVDKSGRDIFELSDIAEKEGRSKAIEPGEPADLVNEKYLKQYREMGREAFIKAVREGEIK